MKKENVKIKLKCLVFILLLYCLHNMFAAECGDVNSSGSIDIVDTLLTIQCSVGLITGFMANYLGVMLSARR